MTVSTERRCSMGRARFSRRRLYTFSTSTMASSTSEPMAMAKPPRLIVLMVSPKALSVRMAATKASGMVTSEMSVVRTFIRKMKSTMTTKMAPSMRALFTLSMELLMKRS